MRFCDVCVDQLSAVRSSRDPIASKETDIDSAADADRLVLQYERNTAVSTHVRHIIKGTTKETKMSQ